MADLTFYLEGVEVEPFAVAPLLNFKLRIRQLGEPHPVQSIALKCQIRIEPAKRPYSPQEQTGLRDLFSTPDRWGQTLKPLLWTHTQAHVAPFLDSILIQLPAPCTFDFTVATTKYFDALESGDIPLVFLFSGTVFAEDADGGLRISQIPWEKEASFRLPVRVWKELMQRYYPNIAWLCLRKDIFDRLSAFKTQRGLPTWEQTMETLLGQPSRG